MSAKGWISDDSSFYGDDETIDVLEERSGSFNSSEYWSIHSSLVSTIAHQARATKKSDAAASTAPDELVYPHEGNHLWYQPSETVSEFLKRCPPHNTVMEKSGIDWFWIDNPHKSAHAKEGPDVSAFVDAGDSLLDDYRKKRGNLEDNNPGMNKGAITKKLVSDRTKLKNQIAELACEMNIVTGKWLLFPTWDDIPRLWKQVCSAVLENRLGPVAKVSTKSLNKSEPCGVIVIYTENCFDVDDVRRVLLALVDLGIVSSREDARPIWYKTDAYTYLQLNSGNEFNLPASLYSSKEMLDDEGHAAKRKAEEMHPLRPKSKGKQRSIADMFR